MTTIYEITRTNGKYSHTVIERSEIPKGSTVYENLITPGHGYTRSSYKTIQRLGIQRAISPCSYMSRSMVYLEEDCDAGILIDAVITAGERFFYRSKYVERCNSGRRSYHPYWIENPVTTGSIVRLKSNNKRVRILSVSRRIILMSYTDDPLDHEMAYRTTPSKLMTQILPEPEPGYLITHPKKGAYIGCKWDAKGSKSSIWSKTHDDNPAVLPVFNSRGSAQAELSRSDTNISDINLITVPIDPWQTTVCSMEIALNHGVEPWRVGPSERNRTIRLCIEYRKRRKTYIHGMIDDKAIDHEIVMPGDLIKVPDSVGELLTEFDSDIITDIKDNIAFVHMDHINEYATLLHERLGMGFTGHTVWQDNCC